MLSFSGFKIGKLQFGQRRFQVVPFGLDNKGWLRRPEPLFIGNIAGALWRDPGFPSNWRLMPPLSSAPDNAVHSSGCYGRRLH
jgi:hypothetical protein